ncbi:MAG: redoxin domain-containing protein [Chloroflexi bacterium]|nr:redoxin domain-containing protein [Chloroflexota bacterium]
MATATRLPPATTGAVALSLGPGVHDFTLPDAHGGEVTLSQHLGEKVVVLTFYRAWW